jgi:hypothetical protein
MPLISRGLRSYVTVCKLHNPQELRLSLPVAVFAPASWTFAGGSRQERQLLPGYRDCKEAVLNGSKLETEVGA